MIGSSFGDGGQSSGDINMKSGVMFMGAAHNESRPSSDAVATAVFADIDIATAAL